MVRAIPNFLKLLTGRDKSVEEAVADGIKYLLKNQGKSGSWGHDIGDLGGGGRGAGTALGILALKSHGGDAAAIDKAMGFLTKLSNIKGADTGYRDYRYWNYGFALMVMAQLYKEKPSADLKSQIEAHLKALEDGMLKSGRTPDSYQYSEEIHGTSALTATCLIGLLEAKAAGLSVPEDTIQKAAKAVSKGRGKSGAYQYHTLPNRGPAGSETGSAARNPGNELALYLAGKSDKEKLQWAVENFFKHRGEVEEIAKKHGGGVTVHVGSHKISPYYYLFGNFFTVQALNVLDKDAKISVEGGTKSPAECIDLIRKSIVDFQKKSGSWQDSGHGGSQYGTAMGLLILSGKQWVGKK